MTIEVPVVFGSDGIGTNNPRWNHDARYFTVHSRLRSRRGPASSHPCAGGCGRRAHQWAYRGGCPGERWGSTRPGAERGGHLALAPYSPDLGRYDPLCSTCHANQRPPLLVMLAERVAERLAA